MLEMGIPPGSAILLALEGCHSSECASVASWCFATLAIPVESCIGERSSCTHHLEQVTSKLRWYSQYMGRIPEEELSNDTC